MLRLLSDPDGFFAERTPDCSLTGPLVAVALAALASVVAAVATLVWTEISTIGGPGLTGILTFFLSAPVSLVMSLIWVVVYAGILHVLASVLGGDGSFDDTFAVAGWSYVVLIPARILSPLLTLLVVEGAAAGVVTAGQATAQSTRLPTLVGSLFLLWQGVIWLFGVKHVHGLPTKRAATVAGIVVAGELAWTVVSVV
jgi:hypothetical protein